MLTVPPSLSAFWSLAKAFAGSRRLLPRNGALTGRGVNGSDRAPGCHDAAPAGMATVWIGFSPTFGVPDRIARSDPPRFLPALPENRYSLATGKDRLGN